MNSNENEKKPVLPTTALTTFFLVAVLVGGVVVVIMTPIQTVYAQWQLPPGCPSITGSFSTDMMLCQANNALITSDPTNNQFKDQVYDPPHNDMELSAKCEMVANNMGTDPFSYCNGAFQECNSYGYTHEECYATHFLDWRVQVPPDVWASIEQKNNAKSAQIDTIYRSQMCPAPDGTWGDYC